MKRFILAFLLLFCVVSLPSAPIRAQEEEPVRGFRSTDLPLPRFVSVKSDKVYVRTGPALRYPIKWIYKRDGLPVEIIQEFDTWRKIRDFENEEGWVHQSLLSGTRHVRIKGEEIVPVREAGREDARMVARFEPGVIAALEKCEPAYCRIEAGGFKGWVRRADLWGVYDGEIIE